MKLWTSLTIDDFEEYLLTDSGPNLTSTPTTGTSPPLASTTTPTPSPVDVTAITTTLSAAMLAKPPSSCTDLFMKNKGSGDDVKPLKEPKQWNTWQQSFLSVSYAYDFKDVTDATYVPDTLDSDAMAVLGLQQKHAFGIVVVNIKESSALPVVHQYSDPNASDYGNAQLLYQVLVAHFTQGLTGRQCLKIIEREIDDLHLDQKWGKTCESFLNLVNNKLKDHII